MWRLLLWLSAAALAVPALTLTMARALDTDNGSMIRIESFTPLALPLYAVAGGAARRRCDATARRPQAPGWWPPRWPWPGWACTCGGSRRRWSGANPAPAEGAERVTVMNANLYEGRATAEQVVRRGPRQRRRHPGRWRRSRPTCSRRWTPPGLAELLPERVGQPDYMVAGTMILANRPLTDHVRLRTDVPGLGGEVRRRSRVLGVHPVAPVDPAGWRADHAAILAAGRGRPTPT